MSHHEKNGRKFGRSLKQHLKLILISIIGLIVLIYGLLIIFPDLK